MPDTIYTRAVRQVVEQDGTKRVLFVASTAASDRMGDIVDQSWVLDNYRGNPVVLVDHHYSVEAVVGRGAVSMVDGALALEVVAWSAKPTAQAVRQDVEDGIVSAVSVGFRPGRSVARSSLPADDPRRAERGDVFMDNELLEVSIVAVPANPEALIAAKAARSAEDDVALRRVIAEVVAEMVAAPPDAMSAVFGEP